MAALERSPADWLPSCTSRIECESEGQAKSTGTGFFYDFPLSGELIETPPDPLVDATGRLVIEVGPSVRPQCAPMLVTNKHVIEGCDFATIWITVAPKGAERDAFGLPIGRTHMPARLALGEDVVLHPNPNVDLCALRLARIFTLIDERGLSLVNNRLYSGHRMPVEQQNTLRHIESVAMVGYPNGLWDHVNNAPLVRRGTTATHPLVSFQGRPEFVIDMACFPGSSGSPVFLYQDGIYHEGGVPHVGVKTKLLGVLYAGPQFTAEGKLELRPVPHALDQIPVSITRIPMNLGHVINASQLDAFASIIQEKHQQYLAQQSAAS